MMKLQTLTLGCSKNKVDTEHILSQVESSYEIIPEGEDVSVDVLLINTCGFIGDAKEESINTIIEMGEYKKKGRLKALIVTGCLGQRYQKEIEQDLPEVDAVLGTNSYEHIVEAVNQVLFEGLPASEALKDLMMRMKTTEVSWAE